MQVFKIEHTDFELTVNCLLFIKAFAKAKTRQKNIEDSTSYIFNTGSAKVLNPVSGSMEKISSKETTLPVFFENADYFFDIDFKKIDNNSSPRILTKLKEIDEKFSYRPKHKLLAGTINFGNNIGKSEIEFNYKINNTTKSFKLIFEVFPTKLDYRSDYLKMIKDIEDAYPNLILDFLKKTYSNYSTNTSSSNDLIWWQIFGGLYDDFLKATAFILLKPHSRLVKRIKFYKADKIKKIVVQQEEEIIQNRHFPKKLYRTEIKELSVDTTENRFFKHALIQTTRKYLRLKDYILYRYSDKVSKEFRRKLNSIEARLKIYSSNPFLKKINSFHGFKQESLLIQKGTGYSTIYKSWVLLNSGLSFLEGIQKLEQKNIAELYEIWCFLEVKGIIEQVIGQEPTEIDLAQIEIDDFVFKFDRGVKSRVLYKKENSDEIEIFHDYQFGKSEKDGLKSYTVNQRPDIVVKLTKNDLKEKYKFTYLYDAKYRLLSDENELEADIPPDDAINQMHRYRDAIYYNNKLKNKPEKEVIGGYILFPGSGNIEQIKSHDFFKSISKVNIGAFPLKPNDGINKILLKEHFQEILEYNSENILREIIPQKELNYENVNPEVLIGIVSDYKHITYFESGTELLYHTGARKPSRFGYKDLKYFSPYIKGKGCKYYYEIIDYSILPRNKIYDKSHELYSSDTSERLVLHLGDRQVIKQEKYYKVKDGITVYRYSKLNYLKNLIGNKILAPTKHE